MRPATKFLSSVWTGGNRQRAAEEREGGERDAGAEQREDDEDDGHRDEDPASDERRRLRLDLPAGDDDALDASGDEARQQIAEDHDQRRPCGLAERHAAPDGELAAVGGLVGILDRRHFVVPGPPYGEPRGRGAVARAFREGRFAPALEIVAEMAHEPLERQHLVERAAQVALPPAERVEEDLRVRRVVAGHRAQLRLLLLRARGRRGELLAKVFLPGAQRREPGDELLVDGARLDRIVRGDRGGTRLPRAALAVEQQLVLLQQVDVERRRRAGFALLLGVAREPEQPRVARSGFLAARGRSLPRPREARLGRDPRFERRSRRSPRALDRTVEGSASRLDVGADPRELFRRERDRIAGGGQLADREIARGAGRLRLLSRGARGNIEQLARRVVDAGPKRREVARPCERRRRRRRGAAIGGFDRKPCRGLARLGSAVSTSLRSASTTRAE